nr:AAA family ATPase [Brevundimonas diminuta]
MLQSIGVENYRTFREPFTLELAPITILLGANSSGKSSITRLPPLIAQSLAERTSAPILWVSEVIDFGSFNENVHNRQQDGIIHLTLSGRLPAPATRISVLGAANWAASNFKYEIEIGSNRNNETILRKINIDIYGESVEMSVTNNVVSSIKFRGKNYKELAKGITIYLPDGMFPAPFAVARDADGRIKIADRDAIRKESIKLLRSYCHSNTSDFSLSKVTNFPFISNFEDTFSRLKSRSTMVPTLFKRFDDISQSDAERLWLILFVSSLPALMPALQSAVAGDISVGGYLAPIRAAAQRYYRRREIAVNAIDPTGENLAMYLNSLQYFELDRINKDFQNFFGHEVSVQKSEGHISLRVGSGGEHNDNLADVGFGFSQLIPVIAQVHAAAKAAGLSNTRKNEAFAPVIAVEQPELHLHPAFQAKLGAYFADVAANGRNSKKFRFLIETHSEPLVNEIASLVGKGEIDPSMVRIYLFDRNLSENISRVLEVSVTKDGQLPSWPFGFFSSGKISNLVQPAKWG